LLRPAGLGVKTGASCRSVYGRGQMARRHPLYRERRQVHVGYAARSVEREAPHQSSEVLVRETCCSDRRWRLSRGVSTETSAACFPSAARVGVFAGLIDCCPRRGHRCSWWGMCPGNSALLGLRCWRARGLAAGWPVTASRPRACCRWTRLRGILRLGDGALRSLHGCLAAFITRILPG
jgi:hypothetical protein